MRRISLRQLLITSLAIVGLMAPIMAAGSASALTPHNGAYVALGDSVAAGDGLLSVPNPTNIDKACSLSSQAYPVIVSRALKMPYVNAACSGATISNLSTAQNINGTIVRPQLDTAFSYGVPSLLSITAGANDAHWQKVLYSCATSNCATPAMTAQMNVYLGQVQANMRAELQQISVRSRGNPPLTLVTGYYDPFSLYCSAIIPAITPTEVNWVVKEVTAINNSLKNSLAGYSFARYVPVTFQGHDLCNPDTWVQDGSQPAPLHPTAVGQIGYAFVVVVAYNQAKAAGL